MGYEINAKIQQSGITKEEFIQKMVDKKISEDKAASIFEQFNTNQSTANIDGKETQVLDKNEQVGLMAFFKQLAGGDSSDTKITRKDFRHNKGDAGAIKDAKYKDYKRAMEAYQELLSSNNFEVNDDEAVNFQNGNKIVTQGEGEDAVSTSYTLEHNNVVSSNTSDGARTEHLTYTNGKVSEDTVEETKDGITTTTVNGEKTKTVENKDGKTITTSFENGGGVRKTEDPNANTITIEEFKGDSPESGSITKKTIINTQDKTATVEDGNTTTKYEGTTDANNLGTVVETTVVEGNKTTTTNLKSHTRTITDNSNNSIKTDYLKDDNSTITKSVTKQGDSTKTEFYNDNGSAVSRTVSQNKSNIIFNDGGNDVSFKLDKDGNITAYAKYENGTYETLDQAAQRLGFKQGTEQYDAFIAANGGKADGYLRAGQALKVGSDIATSTSFNISEAKTDRQTQINNWRAANPEKAAAAAAKRQGIDNLRQTFATKDFQVYYDPSGEQKSRIDGQGKTGGTHYIYQNGKLVNLEDHLKSKGMKLADGEHVIRIGADGTVRTNKNQFYKLDGAKSDQKSYNKSFKAGHAASGGVIRDVSGKALAKTQVTQETGTPESKQYKQMLSAYQQAQAAFDQQMKKDGWAADVADGIAHLWNNDLIELTGNTADMVRRDLGAFNKKLDQLKIALDKDDMETFHRLYNELQSSNIGTRIANYNQSQDDGAAAVKTTTVIAASTAAAIATGGSSLLVEAAAVGGATFAARVATEVSDLATNDIEGDINAQSLSDITKEATVEAGIGMATVGVFRGGSSLIKGAGKEVSEETGIVLRSSTKQESGVVVKKTVSEASEDVSKRLTGKVATGAGKETAGETAGKTAGKEAAGETGGKTAGKKAASETGKKATGNETAKEAEAAAAKTAEEEFLNKVGMSADDYSFLKELPTNKSQWSTDDLNRIAKIFDVSVDDIVNGSKPLFKKLALKFHPDRNNGNQMAHDIFTFVNNMNV